MPRKIALWDDYDEVAFQVVINARGRQSTWPVTAPLPPGWTAKDFTGSRRACLEEIGARWQDPPLDDGWQGGSGGGRATGASALRGPLRAVPDTSVTALIRAQDLPRDRLAARCGTVRVTRGELLDAAAAWARVLVEAGCVPEAPVAVLLPRGVEALVAILAVLEAGGAYVPLSCDDPPRLLQAILADCGAAVTVTTDELAERVRGHGGTVLTLSALRKRAGSATATPHGASAGSLAYVLYPSGAAGEPRGVEGTHRQLVNYALWCRTAFAHHPGEVTFLSTSLFLLGSLTTIFTPLLAGWPIVIAPDGATADALLELSGTAAGGLLDLTPAHVRLMAARGVPGGGLARQLMVGSEPLAFGPELREWMRADPERVVVNHYGPAGTHGCFCHWLTGGEELGSNVPVGRPIDNVEAYIVDRDCALVGVGEVGELLVGGPSIGRGYRGRPRLTAERWIPHPWGDGAVLLRTGDLARLEPDGVVTVLGRAGRQG
ncbi:AMP-binding protein [Nonomuraea sp. GTA35]|uniref:AMP-binding protein n=1 Tax=Nonomuraea sp. GTA35 TaxID=1676746 RepID=UPI0035C1C9EB